MTDDASSPPPAFAFAVSLGPAAASPSGGTPDAAFQEISGIDVHVETDEQGGDGVGAFVRRLPDPAGHPNLMLKRGYVTPGSALAQWADRAIAAALGSPISPRTLIVALIGPDDRPLATWTFHDAWPVKWSICKPVTAVHNILVDTLEIAYATMDRSA